MRTSSRSIAWLVLIIGASVGGAPQTLASDPERYAGPIIDMHLHAFGWDEFGTPPPPHEVTGRQPTARDDNKALTATLDVMQRHGIVLGVASGPLEQVRRWRQAAPERLLGAAYTGPRDELPEVPRLRRLFETGELAVLGELGLQYRGLTAMDESLQGTFALAEELDVPVAIHTGLGDAGTPYGCCPDFRVALGRPSLVEDVLVRHPGLRIYLMHAGYPYLEETKALLTVYPQLYVDIAVLNWALPRTEFHTYLRALMDAGFGDRVMFGSDQMIWPESITMAIEGVESASFLTREQKRAVFYDNAARFLKLPPETITRHHRQTGTSALTRDLIDEVARRHMRERRIPGASIAVVTETDTVTAAYGSAVIQHAVPAAVDTVYEIASLTKQFTAAAVLLLCDEGKLDLDHSIARYIDAAPESWQDITVRQLLTHTAGLAGENIEFASLRNDWRRYTSRELMLESALADPITSSPGERFDYSSLGYFLAALAIERASGMTYREFMQHRLFEPLGLEHTLLQDELRIIPGEARGYSLKNGELVNIWRDAVEEVAGGWGMFSNVLDLVRWDRALRARELMSEASYRVMFSPIELADGIAFRYGLGWWLPERHGIPYQYHSGVTGTEILRIPSHGLTVIVLTNLGRSNSVGSIEANAWGFADAIASALLPEFALETKDLPLADKALDAYTGHWRFGYGEARLFVRDGHLWIEDEAGADTLLYQGDDTFGFAGDAERLVFVRSGEGAVVAAKWVHETAQDDPGERIE